MSGILVLAGSDVSMSDLDEGAVSARIDLNLNLAPPWSSDFLGLGPSSLEELRGVDNQPGHYSSSRRILPRFGPGIHGVFLDLQHELEPQPDQSASAQVRGISPFSSSPSHEQVMPSFHPLRTETLQPNPPVAAPAFSQETVEQFHEGFYDQVDAENEFLLDRDGSENGLLRPHLLHGFRRYTRPLPPAIQVERVEVIPSRLSDSGALNLDSALNLEAPFTRLVDAVKDLDVKEGSSSGEREGEISCAGNFECNICLDMAVDPVLTSCGHLFCWPCLYRWLYVHSDEAECAVCKGAVAESDIVPIYGRGCKTACTRQSTSEDSVVVPPRPHARRRESFRQRYEGWVHGWEWDADRISEVERDDPRAFMWRSNEVMRVRRAFQFWQENIQGTLHTRVRTRRRMADRRERFRAPTAEATSTGATLQRTMGNIQEFLQRRVAHFSENLQEDVVRSLTATGAPQVAERLASLRARVSSRAASTNSYRSVLATISGSGQDDIVIPSLSSNPSSSHTLHGASGLSVPQEASSAQRVDIPIERNEGMGDQIPGRERHGAFMMHSSEAQTSRSSGYTDMGAESSRCRKRRRLN